MKEKSGKGEIDKNYKHEEDYKYYESWYYQGKGVYKLRELQDFFRKRGFSRLIIIAEKIESNTEWKIFYNEFIVGQKNQSMFFVAKGMSIDQFYIQNISLYWDYKEKNQYEGEFLHKKDLQDFYRRRGFNMKIFVEKTEADNEYWAHIAEWQAFYQKIGINFDPSNIAIPDSEENFSKVIIMAKGITFSVALQLCEKYFTCRKNKFADQKYLDKISVSVSGRTSENSVYAIRIHDDVWNRDLDEEKYKKIGESLSREDMAKGINVEEKLIYELKYFLENGDINGKWTYCWGTRFSVHGESVYSKYVWDEMGIEGDYRGIYLRLFYPAPYYCQQVIMD